MEVSPCAQVVRSHAASLLMSLNFQRERAQFCDCVVRQRQSPGQLYPAHRCVLAASSPVLASILSSTGVLVELQAPCLSGSVLALLMDYIYTGTLPYIHSQQHYYSLLTAASYLQMDELQEALGVLQQTEANDADKTNASVGTENQPYKDTKTRSETADSCTRHLPLTCSVDAFRRREEAYTYSVQSTASSLSREDHQYSAKVETCDEAQMHSASTHIKGGEMDICGARSINGANSCTKTDARTLSNVSTCAPVHCAESRQVTHLTPQDLIQNIPCTAEVLGVDKEVQKDRFHPAGTVKPETWQECTEEEQVKTVKDRRNSSSSTSSSPHPCCGAVPVIRHSSGAVMLQLAEVSIGPPYLPVSQASVNSTRTSFSRSASTDNDSIVEGVTTKHKNHYGLQNQDCSNNGTESQDYQNSSNQCATSDLCYKSSRDQSEMLEQDNDSSNGDYFMKQNYEPMDNGSSLITDQNDPHTGSSQNTNRTKHLRDDSVPQNKSCSNFIGGLKYKSELSFDDLSSKHQRMDWSDCSIISVSTAAEKLSQDPRAVVPLPVEDSDTGSNSQCEDLCPEIDTKEEHSYSSRCPDEMDRQDRHCKLHGSKTDWYPKLHKAETSAQRPASRWHEHNSQNRETSMEDKRHSADVCLPISTTPESHQDNVTAGLYAFERHTSLELEKISDTEITEPRLPCTMPVENNMPESMYSAVGQSYHGHLHYHCLSQEDTQLLHHDSDHKLHSNPSQPDYSDQSSDEEETETFASPGYSSQRQHFASRRRDQVLLLDISTKPAELLVSYKHRCEEEEKGITSCQNDAFVTGVRNNDSQQMSEATSVAGVDRRKIKARTKLEAESFGEGETKSWFGDTHVEDNKSVCKGQSAPGLHVIHKAGVVEEISNPKEGGNQGSTITISSPPSVQDSVKAPMSFTSSICIPSTLTTSMPTNISAHLSTPLHHPFQCSLCDRSFSQRGSLNRHVRSHLGVRPFPCPRCPMTFSRQYRVTEHMRVHQRCTMGNDFNKPPASSI